MRTRMTSGGDRSNPLEECFKLRGEKRFETGTTAPEHPTAARNTSSPLASRAGASSHHPHLQSRTLVSALETTCTMAARAPLSEMDPAAVASRPAATGKDAGPGVGAAKPAAGVDKNAERTAMVARLLDGTLAQSCE